MGGHEAARTLRNLGYRGQIIGVTGNASEADMAAFMAHGADAVVTKPVSYPALLDVIESRIATLLPVPP